MCIDLRGIQLRVRMCGEPRPLAIQIRGPNLYQPARDTDSGANVWRVGRAARSASVSRLYFRQHSNRGHGLGSCEACKWIPVLLRVSNQNCAQSRAPRNRRRCAMRLPSPLDGPACPRRSQGSRSQGGGYETHKTHWHVWASSARPHFGGGVVAGHGGVDGAHSRAGRGHGGDIVSDDGSRPGRGKRLRCCIGKHLLHLPHYQRKLYGRHLCLRRLGHAVGVGAREGRQRPHRPCLPHLPVASQQR